VVGQEVGHAGILAPDGPNPPTGCGS
jgi:hypothetical protein